VVPAYTSTTAFLAFFKPFSQIASCSSRSPQDAAEFGFPADEEGGVVVSTVIAKMKYEKADGM
ncbi:hypothetical protein N5C43_21640, partial [Comamonas terrigena]|uniref:hypothetical protein n=1 Tax=Comamonas terrigena TaxID=32013 RepID=UPI002449790A